MLPGTPDDQERRFQGKTTVERGNPFVNISLPGNQFSSEVLSHEIVEAGSSSATMKQRPDAWEAEY